jgi:hypothetical protein
MKGFRRISALHCASLIGVFLAGASCGGGAAQPDSGSTGSAGTGGAGTSGGGTTPVAQCNQLVSTLCTRLNTCNMLDGSAQDQSDCNTLENVEFGCDRATSANFPTCLSDVKLLSCAALFPPMVGLVAPASCDEPLNTIPLSTAQMKCADLAAVICDKIAMCDGIMPTQADLLQCQQDVYSQIGCGFAVDVGPMYAQCLQDFPNSSCATADGGAAADGGMMGSVPSCTGVIKGPLP